MKIRKNTGMIISRWQGFEIDSSEGYYIFRKEPEHTEENWNVMLRLLRSPLILDKIAFSLLPRHGKERELRKKVKALEAEARLERSLRREEFLHEDFLYLDYKAPIPVFLEIVDEMRSSLKLIQLNFCFKPFPGLPPEELERLRTWFLQPGNAAEDVRWARKRWDALARVREKDLDHLGFTDNRNADNPSLAFEANFQLDLEKPFTFEVTTSVVDPTLIEYLFMTLMTGFAFESVAE